jgi:hypothetical protein
MASTCEIFRPRSRSTPQSFDTADPETPSHTISLLDPLTKPEGNPKSIPMLMSRFAHRRP